MSAWANIENPKPINFADILSEEITRDLQSKKEKSVLDPTANRWLWIEKDYCDEDLKCSKEKITLNYDFETNLEEDDVECVRNEEHFDIFDDLENELTHNTELLNGQQLQNSDEVINNHDIFLREKKKGSEVFSLPFKLRTDSGKILDFNSSHNLFKSLKKYFRKEERGVQWYNSHFFFYQIITSGLLQDVDHVINTSSESIILHGTLDPYYEHDTLHNWPKNCVIKVFKNVSKVQANLSCKGKKEVADKEKPIEWWAQREMNNLERAWKAGISCPQVIQLKGSVLVTSFIGKDGKSAAKLKYAGLCGPDYINVYEQVKNAMKKLYENGNLIHGRMSEHSILWQDGQCYFTDFTHSVHPSHEHGYYFLHQDCVNITEYFKLHIPEDKMESPDELFEYITDFYYCNLMICRMRYFYTVKPDVYHKPY